MLTNELNLVGKILSGKSSAIPFHTYAIGTGFDRKDRTTACRLIKVSKKGSNFIFDYKTNSYCNENVLPNAYSLLYKNCLADTSHFRRYLFGDICIPVKENLLWPTSVKRVQIPMDLEGFKESFATPEAAQSSNLPKIVIDFQNAFWENVDKFWEFIIQEHEKIIGNKTAEGLKNYTALYIHFDLSEIIGKEHWYELENVLEVLDNLEIDKMKKEGDFVYSEEAQAYILKKKFFPGVSSGNDKNDNQFVGFDPDQAFKSFSLEEDKLRYIFYHKDIINACRVRIPYSHPYSFRLIPNGDFSSEQGFEFLSRLNSISNASKTEDIEKAEDQIKIVEKDNFNLEDLFVGISEGYSSEITSFDLTLVQQGQNTLTNVTEINNMDRSTLYKNSKILSDKIKGVRVLRKLKDNQFLNIPGAFYDIYMSKEERKSKNGKEKYQVKFLDLFMSLYQDSYYGNPDLEHAYVERVYSDLRSDGSFKNCWHTTTAYILLKTLAKEKSVERNPRIIQGEEKSRELGVLLAKVCWPMNFVKKTFTKSTIGSLSKRITVTQPMQSIEGLACEFRERIIQHVGESAGNHKVVLNGKAFADAESIIQEFKKDTMKFSKNSFLCGFAVEFDHQVFFASKPAKIVN